MGFKQDFLKLLDKYERLPYVDEHLGIEKGNKYYDVVLEIREITTRKEKPTHDSVESMIEYMLENKNIRTPVDDPGNHPALIGFVDITSEDVYKHCSVSLQSAAKAKMLSREILAEVEKREKQT